MKLTETLQNRLGIGSFIAAGRFGIKKPAGVIFDTANGIPKELAALESEDITLEDKQTHLLILGKNDSNHIFVEIMRITDAGKQKYFEWEINPDTTILEDTVIHEIVETPGCTAAL